MRRCEGTSKEFDRGDKRMLPFPRPPWIRQGYRDASRARSEIGQLRLLRIRDLPGRELHQGRSICRSVLTLHNILTNPGRELHKGRSICRSVLTLDCILTNPGRELHQGRSICRSVLTLDNILTNARDFCVVPSLAHFPLFFSYYQSPMSKVLAYQILTTLFLSTNMLITPSCISIQTLQHLHIKSLQ